jgi:signal transduction histidine kinase
MTRLYWRIFFSFWLVIILTVVVTVAVNTIAFRDEMVNTRFSALNDSLGNLSRQAQQALDSGGEAELRRWLERHQAQQPAATLLIIGPGGQELLRRPLPAMSERVRREMRRMEEGRANLRRPRPPRIQRLEAADGQAYRMMIPGFRPRLGGWFMRPEARAIFPVILVLLSGAACLLLARYLTQPIRAFRTAGQSIAAGDLDARVGPAIAKRKDEFGELATDFDRMADRIQNLLDSQQQLLRDVSHELRSPLARLQAALGLIRQKNANVQDVNLDRIEQEAENLNAMIGEILSMARLDTATEIERQAVDLNDLVVQIVDDARFEGERYEKSIAFTPGPVCIVEIDESLIHKAIENIVRNAIQHSRQHTEVSIEALPDAGAKVSISDDGPGVRPDDAEKIFEPFFTRHADGRSGTAGAGVGLTIARRAIELHGGAISARNADRGGLIVEIELPASGFQV